eukprot:GFUD01095484.1.p1 GENE.GFUD01095484.1~~GFUD01095484.1.p1  ORF type:complete len:162 (+),score=52.23 GFUD01095484.1:67-552(+)
MMAQNERKLSGERLDELRGVFNSIDKNGDGVLCIAELEHVFKLVGITESQTITAIIAQWDVEGTGKVSFQDFVKIMEQRDLDSSESMEEKDDRFIRKAFSSFDANNDGFITREELKTVLEQMGHVTESEVTTLLKEADTNRDNKIDIEEFVIVMKETDVIF